MTAVGESQIESRNFVSDGSNFSKKHKKRKNHDSGEDPVYEAPIKSALVSAETVPDAAYENTRRHKKKKHRSHESDEIVDGMTQSIESCDQTPKKHKKHRERVVSEELWNGNEIEVPAQGIEQTDKSTKKHKHRKQAVEEITEEQNCRDEDFTLESTQFSPTERKKRKRHNSERYPDVEREQLDVTEQHDNSRKRRRRETLSEEASVAQDGDAVEKNRKRKRFYNEASFDESRIGHQNIHSENETEVVAKKKKDAKEVNIATDILKKLTAIDEEVLKVKRHKERHSKQKASDASKMIDDNHLPEASGHDKKRHKGQRMDRKKKREENEQSAAVEAGPKTPKAKDEKKKEKKKKKKKKELPEITEHEIFPKRDMTADELRQLFDRLLVTLPSSDHLHYTAREVLIDWGHVKFENFVSDYCKRQWLKVLFKMRKVRTLHEIVQDAKNHGISKNSGNLLHRLSVPEIQYLSENINGLRQELPDATEDELLAEGKKRYKQLSKDEQSKYAKVSRVKGEVVQISGLHLYVDTKVKEYLRTHPKSEQSAVVKKFRKRWSLLDDRRKVKYIRRARAQYKAFQSDNQQKPGTSTSLRLPRDITKDEQKILDRINGVPPKPLSNAYMLFCERIFESVHKEKPELNPKEMMYEFGHRWAALTKDEQERYKRELVERNRVYKEFLDQHPEVECETLTPAKHSSTNSHKRRERKIEFKGEPEKPVDSGYMLFSKELKPSLKNIHPKELFRECARQWAELSKEEKSEYAEKVNDVKRKYKEKLAAFKAELSPEDRLAYEKIHPSKKPNHKKSSGKKITKLDAKGSNSVVEKSQAPSLLTVSGKEKKKDKGKKKKSILQEHHCKESSYVGTQQSIETGLSRSFSYSEMSHVSDSEMSNASEAF